MSSKVSVTLKAMKSGWQIAPTPRSEIVRVHSSINDGVWRIEEFLRMATTIIALPMIAIQLQITLMVITAM